MMDEHFDRNYQAGREAFNAGVDRGLARLGKTFAATFNALHRIQWSAPWSAEAKDVGHA
jgi:hypothetical protein